jgi:hypothetical protein
MSALVTALSLALDSVGAFESEGQDFPWQWFALVGFVLFAGFVIWRSVDLQHQIEALTSKHPLVKLTPRYEGHLAWFDAENIGAAEGFFAVRIDVEGTSKGQLSYYGRWQRVRDEKGFRMSAGDVHTVEVMKSEGFSGSEQQYQMSVLDSYQTISAYVLPSAKLKLRVRVTSTPSLQHPFEKHYELRLGEKDVWNSFDEVS